MKLGHARYNDISGIVDFLFINYCLLSKTDSNNHSIPFSTLIFFVGVGLIQSLVN